MSKLKNRMISFEAKTWNVIHQQTKMFYCFFLAVVKVSVDAIHIIKTHTHISGALA